MDKVIAFIILGFAAIGVLSLCVNTNGCKDMMKNLPTENRSEQRYKITATAQTPDGKIVKKEAWITTTVERVDGNQSQNQASSTITAGNPSDRPTVDQILLLRFTHKALECKVCPSNGNNFAYVVNHSFNCENRSISLFYNDDANPQVLPPHSRGGRNVEVLTKTDFLGNQTKYFVYYCPEYHEATIAWMLDHCTRYEKYRYP